MDELLKQNQAIGVGWWNFNRKWIIRRRLSGSRKIPGLVRKVTVAAVATSLLFVPTAVIAAAPVAPIAAVTPAAVTPSTANPWLALSAMTTSSSSAAAATAAAQDYDVDDDGVGFPPLPVLAVILATIGVAIYILASDDDGDLDGFDISPV